MNKLIVVLMYIAGVMAGGLIVSLFCIAFAFVFHLDVTNMWQGGAFIGAILGISSVHEARKPLPLWRQYMDDYEQ